MDTSYIITFIGDDRPGLVEQVASTIEQCNGNWLESRLSQLGGKFAGLVLVSLAGDGQALESALKGLSTSGLSVRVTPANAAGFNISQAREIRIRVIGPDRPGIVAEVTRALADHAVNVVGMESEVTSAPRRAEHLFEARIEAEVEQSVSLDALIDTLDDIANQMTLDLELDRS